MLIESLVEVLKTSVGNIPMGKEDDVPYNEAVALCKAGLAKDLTGRVPTGEITDKPTRVLNIHPSSSESISKNGGLK